MLHWYTVYKFDVIFQILTFKDKEHTIKPRNKQLFKEWHKVKHTITAFKWGQHEDLLTRKSNINWGLYGLVRSLKQGNTWKVEQKTV